MIKLIHRYIAKHILVSTFTVLAVLAAVTLFVELIYQLEDIGQGGFSILQALGFSFLTLPTHLYTFFPIAAFLGGIMGLGGLANNSELVVMRAGGLSPLQLAKSVVISGLILASIALVLGEALAPQLLELAKSRKTTLLTSGQTLKTKHGIWLHQDNRFTHIQKILPGPELQEITIYTFNKQSQLTQESFAKKAIRHEGQWQLQNVQTSFISPQAIKTKSEKVKIWQLKFDPKVLATTMLSPSQMTLSQLYRLIHAKPFKRLNHYLVIFYKRALQPLTTCILLLLAIPFILGPLRSANRGLRLVTGVFMGFGFYLLSSMTVPLGAVWQLPPLLLVLAPSLLFLGLTGSIYWLVRR